MEKLLHYLSAIHPLPDELITILKKEMRLLPLPKGFKLLEAPRISDHAYFLETGFAMSYTYVNGRKRVDHFWKAGEVIISPHSFFDQVPSEEFIELMELSEVWHIRHDVVVQLMNTFEEARLIHQHVMNHYYSETRERIHLMRQLKAGGRYQLLCKNFPRIELIIPHQYIASYLGIATQSLSRIKKRRDV